MYSGVVNIRRNRFDELRSNPEPISSPSAMNSLDFLQQPVSKTKKKQTRIQTTLLKTYVTSSFRGSGYALFYDL